MGFPRFEPVLHDAEKLISIGCMEHECDGLLRERLDFSFFFNGWWCRPSHSALGAELCLHLHEVPRILTDADLAE